jgi:hypothetical protein
MNDFRMISLNIANGRGEGRGNHILWENKF